MPSTLSRALRGLIAVFLALGVLLVPATSAHADTTQGITGTMTGAGQGPMPGFLNIEPVDPTVTLTPDITSGWCDTLCGSWYVADDGTFSVALPAGQYWVRFTSPLIDQWAPEWWGGSATRQGSTKVTVTDGALTSLSTELAHGGEVSGTIDPAYGRATVEAWLPDSTYRSGFALLGVASTDENGAYEIIGLPSAAYRIHVLARSSKREGWWQGATSLATATPVTVTAPATTSAISPTLNPMGSISGKVTLSGTGAPNTGGFVSLFRQDELGRWSQADDWATTGADGSYSITTPAGAYRVKFWAPINYREEYWNNAATLETGLSATIATNQVTPNINAVLEQTQVLNSSAPQITGTRRVGSVLTATGDTWMPTTVSFTRQWFRSGVAIPGAVGKTYTLGVADLGRSITAQVTASAAAMSPASATSNGTALIQSGLFVLTSKAAMTGSLIIGRTLLAVPAKSTPGATVKYQWLRNGAAIKAATKNRYLLAKADKGKKIGVRMTLTRPGFTTVVKTITRTSAVK